MTTHQAPEYPVGSHVAPERFDAELVARQIEDLAAQPLRLRDALRGLGPAQLETRYRNWTVRQIAHHIGDSTANFYIRWKLALTESHPTIKPYDESHWARQPDSVLADPELTLRLFEGIAGRWATTARAMTPADFARTFHHPQYQRDVALWQALSAYVWHGNHHIGQIAWLREHYRW
jgi:uncharacterized damage-inducible protein DinB